MARKQASEGKAVVAVRVQPRASRDEVLGWRDGALAVRVTAPPVDGAANEAVRRLLANILGVRPRQVELLSGAASREKRFRIAGLTPAELEARITGRDERLNG